MSVYDKFCAMVEKELSKETWKGRDEGYIMGPMINRGQETGCLS